jgi:hypothetical protein
MKYPRTPLKTLIIAAAAILLGAPAALAAAGTHNLGGGGADAANTTLSRQCTILSKQFDKAEAAHKTDQSYKKALAIGTEGETLCHTGNKQAAGVEYLHSAMKLIGIKAKI